MRQRERSAANDKLKKLEEENQRLKRMLEQKAGPPGGAEKKRKADAEPERPAKKPKAAEAPAKKAKNKDVGSKAPKGARTDDSNFMKMIREQGLDKAASAAKSKGKGGSGGSGGGGSKSELQAALEEDLREIEELKSKLGGKWRDELAQDGWLDLFDSMDSECPFPRTPACPPASSRPPARNLLAHAVVSRRLRCVMHLRCNVFDADLGQDSGEEDPFGDSDGEHDSP